MKQRNSNTYARELNEENDLVELENHKINTNELIKN